MQVEIELNRRNWYEIFTHLESTEFLEAEFDKVTFGFHYVKQIKLVRTMEGQYFKCYKLLLSLSCGGKGEPGFWIWTLKLGMGLYGERRVQTF